MSLRRAVLVACLAFAVPACSRRTGPDENYYRARALYQQIYGTQLDEAYDDPRMDDVIALLQKVDRRSVDAPQSAALLDTVVRGKEQLAQERAAREKLAEKTAKDMANPPGIDPEKILATLQADAGAPQDPYGSGADVAVLNGKSGGCLTENEPFAEQGTRVRGTIYRLSQSEDCRQRLPGFVGQAVLVVGGKIYRRIPDPVVAQGGVRPDAG